MGRAALLALCSIVLSIFAGCASSGTNASSNLDAAAQSLDVKATQDTGVIRGLVLDTTIKTIAGAKVSAVLEGKTFLTNSTSQGAFGFEGLKPGTYVVRASKLGFLESQTTVDVVAGVSDPKVTRLVLETDPQASKPSHDLYTWTGYIECSPLVGFPGPVQPIFGGGVFFSCPVDPTNQESISHTFDVSGNVSGIQVVLSWKPTQSFGQQLYYNVFTPPNDQTTCNDCYKGGDSPLTVSIRNATELKPFEKAQQILVETGTNGAGDPTGVYGPGGSVGGLSFEQPFEYYVVVFHGYPMPEGYDYITQGEPKDPTA